MMNARRRLLRSLSIDLLLFCGIAMLGSMSVAAQPASVEIDTASLVRIPSQSEPTWDTTELQRRVKYPAKAREAGLEGDVIVMTQVSAEGKVLHSIIYRSDNRIFEQAAIDAIKDLTMTPARKNNEPISSWVKINVSFRLH